METCTVVVGIDVPIQALREQLKAWMGETSQNQLALTLGTDRGTLMKFVRGHDIAVQTLRRWEKLVPERYRAITR